MQFKILLLLTGELFFIFRSKQNQNLSDNLDDTLVMFKKVKYHRLFCLHYAPSLKSYEAQALSINIT